MLDTVPCDSCRRIERCLIGEKKDVLRHLRFTTLFCYICFALRRLPEMTNVTSISLLQDLCAQLGRTPNCKLMSVEGGVHASTVMCRVQVNDVMATATGQSREEAKHAACKAVLERLLAKDGEFNHGFVSDGVSVNAENLNEIIASRSVTDNQNCTCNHSVETFYQALSRRRLLILLRVLEIMSSDHLDRAEVYNHFHCVRVMCEMVWEPLITTNEIKTFLCSLLECDESHKTVQDICLRYSQVNPMYQPKALKQLIRTTIRKSLRASGTIKHGVHKLGIPKRMKSFILRKSKKRAYPQYGE